jgi:hypothetical protein
MPDNYGDFGMGLQLLHFYSSFLTLEWGCSSCTYTLHWLTCQLGLLGIRSRLKYTLSLTVFSG